MILIPKESECSESPHSDQITGIRFRGFRFLNWVEGGIRTIKWGCPVDSCLPTA